MANIVDYQNLEQAKINSGKKFDDMLQNLETMKNQITQMSEDSAWKGMSGNYFNEVFEEIKTKINAEREEFNQAIDERLNIWFESFQQAEKDRIQAAKQM